MQHSITALSRLLIPLVTLCLASLASGIVRANPVLVDEQSLDNGAYLYDLYCSDCHGVSTVAPDLGWNSGSTAQQPYDYSELIDVAQAQKPVTAEDDEWPAWYQKPEDAPESSDVTVRSQVMNEITQVIDDAYGIAPDTVPDTDDWGADDSLAQELEVEISAFDPVPGVTNLADPAAYYYGTSEDDMFESIANGTGAAMPGWRIELGSDEAVWDLVNYIRSFWSEEWQY